MERYQCTVCGYVYDSDYGDPDQGVGPETRFDELPEDWLCPECSADPDDFIPEG